MLAYVFYTEVGSIGFSHINECLKKSHPTKYVPRKYLKQCEYYLTNLGRSNLIKSLYCAAYCKIYLSFP